MVQSKWTPAWVALFAFLIAAVVAVFFGAKALLNFASVDMFGFRAKQTAGERKELAEAKTDRDKVFPMAQIAKYDVDQGNLTEARTYATKLLAMAPEFHDGDDPEHGIAIHDGYMILGRLALKDGNRDQAKSDLLMAGSTNGAPTLDSFGPNMSLAKDLLEVGEKATVLQYLEECRKFWGYQSKTIDSWEQQIKDGDIPDFGANLIY